MGLPTVSQHTEFKAPSRMGERVTLGLDLLRVGGSSSAQVVGHWGSKGVNMAGLGVPGGRSARHLSAALMLLECAWRCASGE